MIFRCLSLLCPSFNNCFLLSERWQRLGINTIKYHTWPMIPHGKVTKTQINIIKESQEVSPFPAGDYKAAMNRHKSMTTQDINSTNDPQKKYPLGTVSKNILLEGLNRFHGANVTLSSDVDQELDVWFAWRTPNLSITYKSRYKKEIKQR